MTLCKLEVTAFANPSSWSPWARTFISPPNKSGKGRAHASSAEANVTLKQGYLEAANVKMVDGDGEHS